MRNEGRENELRTHIRERLLNYALTHLTVNYITFTENAVTILLHPYLSEISTSDPNSLALPIDPFETLWQSFGIAPVTRYDEDWTADHQTVLYIKSMHTWSSQLRVEKCFFEADEHYDYHKYRPMSPILTARARRLTPRLGRKAASGSTMPASLADIVKSNSTHPVEVETPTEPTAVNLEDALDLKISMRGETCTATVNLVKQVNSLRPNYVNINVDAFLRSSSPVPLDPRSESPFMPLFARDRVPGYPIPSNDILTGMTNLSELSSLVSIVRSEEDNEGGSDNEHMRVVDGWQTYAPSSPMTPTSEPFDPDDEIDELFSLSSPNTEPLPFRMLMDAMIEDVEIPRTEKLGSGARSLEPLGIGKCLGSFILPLITVPEKSVPTQPQPSPPQSSSVVGQASVTARSGNITGAETDMAVDRDEEDLDTAIGRTYRCLQRQRQDPRDVILLEKLDEVDENMECLMEVPILPSPNIHPPNEMFLADSLRALVAPAKGRDENAKEAQVTRGEDGCLKKAKGIKSLNLELSWIPFKGGLKTLTTEELVDVFGYSGSFREFGIDESQVRSLLEQVLGVDSPTGCVVDQARNYDTRLGLEEFDTNVLKRVDYGENASEMILTREERERSSYLVLRTSTEAEAPQDIDNLKDTQGEGYSDINDSGISVRRLHNPLPHRSCGDSNGFDMPDETSFHFSLGTRCQSQSDTAPYLNTEGEPWSSFEPTLWKDGGFPFVSNHPSFVPSMEAKLPSCSNAPVEAGQETHLSSSQTLDSHSSGLIVCETARLVPALLALSEMGSNPKSPHLTQSSLGAAGFAVLRGKQVVVQEPELDIPRLLTTEPKAPDPCLEGTVCTVPEELVDGNTLRLPCPLSVPSTVHRYLMSTKVLQKQTLFRKFRTRGCFVDVVEHDSLGEVDLVLDPHSAVLFVSLLALPVECDGLVAKLCEESWRYSQLLVVFEVYPESQSYLPDLAKSEINCYSPCIIKAVKKLRRNLGIAEACDTKSGCCVYLAFAHEVEEAALFARYFGDLTEANDRNVTGGGIWDNRDWLEVSMCEDENERDLALVEGMNAFAARAILCRRTLEEFLELTAEERMDEFGGLIGCYRIEMLNRVLGQRQEGMECMEIDGKSWVP